MSARYVLAALLLGGSRLLAVEQEADAAPVQPGPAPSTYVVVIIDRGIPSWFAGLRITGMKRVERSVDADFLVQVHGGDPIVEWTSIDRGRVMANRRLREGWTSPFQRPDGMGGLGRLPCWITVERRVLSGSAEVLANLDLSRSDEVVYWSAPWARQSYAWLSDVGSPTPTGTAAAWGRQAWAEVFQSAEMRLGWLAEHEWRSGEVYSP